MPIDVVIEAAAKRTFVATTDWPGWARGGKTEEGAIEAFVTYGPRYAAVIHGIAPIRPPGKPSDLNVIEHLDGDSGTEFGIPSSTAKADLRPIDDAELARQIAILEASRRAFDTAANKAVGVSLTTGPRGGGRTLDKMVRHVVEADQAYLQQLGSSRPDGRWSHPKSTAPRSGNCRCRRSRRAYAASTHRTRTPSGSSGSRAIFVRRAAWHLLDHAWEIEDRSSG
jgi:hypothetical protein